MSNTIWRGRFYRYAPVFFWAGLVLYLSTSGGSMDETSRIIGPLLHWLFPSTPEETIRAYHAFIRKAAHFSEYAVLSLLAAAAFAGSHISLVRTRWFIWAIILSVGVACVDEFNQSFNPARTGSPYDVLLDSAGAVTAAAVFYLWRAGRGTRR